MLLIECFGSVAVPCVTRENALPWKNHKSCPIYRSISFDKCDADLYVVVNMWCGIHILDWRFQAKKELHVQCHFYFSVKYHKFFVMSQYWFMVLGQTSLCQSLVTYRGEEWFWQLSAKALSGLDQYNMDNSNFHTALLSDSLRKLFACLNIDLPVQPAVSHARHWK